MQKENVLKLLSSIVINVEESAKFINLQIQSYTDIPISQDKTTWRYYMNLAGLKHVTNEQLKMISLDTDEEFIMTKESLLEHPNTRIELEKYDAVFDYVNKDNGMQEQYLRGIIKPIPLEGSTVAENYEVLYLDPSLISRREDELRKDIQYSIQTFMGRWYDSSYEFEDRYLPSILAQIYSIVGLTIMKSRIGAANTEKADIDTIKTFLRSNLDVANLLDHVSDDVMLWLYSNIKGLMRNTSKDSTLQSVIDNVLLPSGVDVFDVKYTSPSITLNIDPSNVIDDPWHKDARLELVTRNNSLSKEQPQQLSETTYLDLEDGLTGLTGDTAINENNHVLNTTKGSSTTMLTKSLMVENMVNNNNIEPDSTYKVLENWLYDSFKGFNTTFAEVDLGLSGKLSLTSLDAAYYMMYLMLGEVGCSTNIRAFVANEVVVDDNFSSVKQMKNSRDIGVVDYMSNMIPLKAVSYTDLLTYINYIKEVKSLGTKIWQLQCTVSEKINVHNIDLLTESMYTRDSKNIHYFNVNKELFSLGDYLLAKEFDLNPINADQIMEVLFSTFTGEVFDKDVSATDRVGVFTDFLNKVVSYNIQVLKDSEKKDSRQRLRGNGLIRGLDAGLILDIELMPLNLPIEAHELEPFIDTNVKMFETTGDDVYVEMKTTTHDLSFADIDEIIFSKRDIITEFTLKPEKFIPHVNMDLLETKVESVLGTFDMVTRSVVGIDNELTLDDVQFDFRDVIGTVDTSTTFRVAISEVKVVEEDSVIITDVEADDAMDDVNFGNVYESDYVTLDLKGDEELILFEDDNALTTTTDLITILRPTSRTYNLSLDGMLEELVFGDQDTIDLTVRNITVGNELYLDDIVEFGDTDIITIV